MPTISLAQCEMAQPGEVVTTSLMRLLPIPRYLKFACPYAEVLCLGALRQRVQSGKYKPAEPWQPLSAAWAPASHPFPESSFAPKLTAN